MKKYLLLAVSILALAAVSCKKDGITSEGSEAISDLSVPDSFDWGTSRDVNFSISVSDSRFGNSLHVISVYAGDPDNGGELLSKGGATLTSAFNTRIYLPVMINEVYITKIAPDGSKVSHKVDITSTDVSLSIGESNVMKSMRKLSAVGFSTSAVAESSPSCASGTGVTTIRASVSNFKAQNGAVYSITASDIVVGLDWGHNGTLYVCGKNVRLVGGNINGLNIIITSTGSASIEGSHWGTTSSIKNFGSLTINADQWSTKVIGSLYNTGIITTNYLSAENGTVTNFGTITAAQTIWMNTGAVLNNYGTINALGQSKAENGGRISNSGTYNAKGELVVGASPSRLDNYGTFNVFQERLTMNSAGSIVNSGKLLAVNAHLEFGSTFVNDGELQVKSFNGTSGTFTNRCKLIVLTDFNLNGATMVNESFIDVKGNTTMNSNMTLSPKSMFRTANLLSSSQTVSGPPNGTEWALFRVTGTSADLVESAGGTFTGRVMYCDPKRSLSARHLLNSAKNGCDIYIAANECTEGYGVDPNPPLVDTDKDGVIDQEDQFPNDPTKAFKSYGVNYSEGGSTVAFEDRWPYQGDYDMNDVVISYRYEIVTNSENQVVTVDADFKLIATGGEYNNGAGIQFNIPKSNLVSISGATAEDNQDSLVVILFKNTREEQTNWNTSKATAAESKSYKVFFQVKNGPTLASFGLGRYNMFIWNNTPGFGRGYETHLPGQQPTKLANRSLFGTGDDNTTLAKPYYSKNGLVWALELPIANYAYPIENAEITRAYKWFADWARNGGKAAPLWYTDLTARNSAMIFSK
ncbi:MAG: LruC domain-containing protein [Arcticibacter sp.]